MAKTVFGYKFGEKTFGINTAGLFCFFGAIFVLLYLGFFPDGVPRTINALIVLSPAWMPIFGSLIFYRMWVRYRRSWYHQHQPTTLLEIKIPREQRKSPLAMEAVLSAMFVTFGETTFIDRNILGKTRTWFSLEMVSTEGDVHFYVWTRKFYAPLFRSHLYAHYPDVEVYEVEDYTKYIPFDLDKYQYYGCDFKLTAADPLPIKSYIDYGLDQTGAKEEEKTDPLAAVIEFLGSVSKGNHVWLQILIQGHRGHRKWPWSKRLDVKDKAEEEVTRLLEHAAKRSRKVTGSLLGEEDELGYSSVNLTESEREQIKVIYRHAGKLSWDAGVRGLHVSEKDKFNAIFLVGMLAVWRSFNATYFNALRYTRYLAGFDYPWQDFGNIMRNWQRRRIYEAYRRRSWFHEPYKTSPFVLSTEELATLYHFPGEVLKTPTAPRIPSKRAEPPSNLPV